MESEVKKDLIEFIKLCDDDLAETIYAYALALLEQKA